MQPRLHQKQPRRNEAAYYFLIRAGQPVASHLEARCQMELACSVFPAHQGYGMVVSRFSTSIRNTEAMQNLQRSSPWFVLNLRRGPSSRSLELGYGFGVFAQPHRRLTWISMSGTEEICHAAFMDTYHEPKRHVMWLRGWSKMALPRLSLGAGNARPPSRPDATQTSIIFVHGTSIRD